MIKKKLIQLITEPFFQFMFLGACIYGAFGYYGKAEDPLDSSRIVINSTQIDMLITQWESRWKRPPTRVEIQGLIDQYIKEEVLYLQAVKMGLAENDPITRRRMAQKLEFLIGDLASLQVPTDEELQTYYTEHTAEYRTPDKFTFIHVFIDPDLRKNKSHPDALSLLAELEVAGVPDAKSLKAGDRFMGTAYYSARNESEISRSMGSGFTSSLAKLEPGEWQGPILSGFGIHLVYVYEKEKGHNPPLADVKEDVLSAWRLQNQSKMKTDFLVGLKKQYEIVIDDLPEERLLMKDTAAIKKSTSKSEIKTK